MTRLETDSPEILNNCIFFVKKGGTIGVIGAYYQNVNHFNIGGLMEKGLTISGGQTPIQKYW
jgi:threonine dehydrogenase-like Zn-dependent dehydrogenase